ncbi:MAG TPA: GIY-YIG nuclease family protein [Gemmatimonadales bacterium]|nr:GIY-YIG nuclease family protein [Gemmatimonadales bacterium]
MGVGVGRNAADGKLPLAAGQDIPSFRNRHQAQLRLGEHPSRARLEDWKAQGAETFAFEVLDTLAPKETQG